MKVKVNTKGKKSISASLLSQVEEAKEQGLQRKLTDISEDAVAFSPVDTGAYVTSFSIVPAGSGAGRMRTSKNKPKRSEADAKAEAKSQLQSDIARLDLKEGTRFVLRNRAPHARSVEDGGPGWRRPGHGVFRKLRNIY